MINVLIKSFTITFLSYKSIPPFIHANPAGHLSIRPSIHQIAKQQDKNTQYPPNNLQTNQSTNQAVSQLISQYSYSVQSAVIPLVG